MISTKRKEIILEQLYQLDSVSVEELVDLIHASAATIRRDLTNLENEGKVRRIHGGAQLSKESRRINEESELSSNRKTDIHLAEKQRIAKRASGLVIDGDCIFIDSGTTPAIIYEFIRHKNVTILTNNYMVIEKVKHSDTAKVIFGAGEFNAALKLVGGFLFLDIIKQFSFDHAFIGTSGFNLKSHQCTCTTLEASSFKKYAMLNSEHSYLVADSSKRNEKGIVCFALLEEFDSILTNEFPDKTDVDNIVFCT